VNTAPDVPAAGKQAVPPTASEDEQWNRDYGKWRRARLRRVQASARVWLGVLTALLGLLGSVVLFKGGDLVTGVTSNGWWQVALIALVGLVFATAVSAVAVGGVATWGGLEDIVPDIGPAPSEPDNDPFPNVPGNGAHLQPTPPGHQGASWLKPSWQKTLFRVVLWLGFIPKDDRDTALLVFEHDGGRAEHDWQRYRDDIVDNADRNRIYLHASRVVGVFAAAFIAMLAIAAVVAGTVSPAPSDVIVIHNGRLTCGPFGDSAKDTDVTQVIPVTSC
jgi:hypothetical protein